MGQFVRGGLPHVGTLLAPNRITGHDNITMSTLRFCRDGKLVADVHGDNGRQQCGHSILQCITVVGVTRHVNVPLTAVNRTFNILPRKRALDTGR